jgi:hypothetical protein
MNSNNKQTLTKPGKIRAATTKTPQKMMTTSCVMPKSTWELLRFMAVRRAAETGGRFSVSAVITSLVERHRGDLERS